MQSVRVKALVPCYVGNGFRNEGDVFLYTGPPNPRVLMVLADENPREMPQKTADLPDKKVEVDAERAAQRDEAPRKTVGKINHPKS